MRPKEILLFQGYFPGTPYGVVRWHGLIPQIKGFVAPIGALRDHVEAVYDLTIGYVGGVPTIGQWIKGEVKIVHLHVRHFPIKDVPENPGDLAAWLIRRFEEKDALLDHFYRHGAFPDENTLSVS